MLNYDLEMPATVVVIPPPTRSGRAETARRDITLASAVRYVVEQMPPEEKPRAVIRTPTQSLFIEEIEALYERTDFPKPLSRG